MEHNEFKLHSDYAPTGDQPQAIEKLTLGFKQGNQFETLLGQDLYDGEHHPATAEADTDHLT